MADERPPRRRALLLENIHSGAAELLSEAGFEVERQKGALDEAALVEHLDEIDVLGIRSRTQVTETVLEKSPGLVAVGAFCIGTNQIDLAAATQRGVTVFNAPFSNTRSVVELVIAEIIALTRRLTEKNSEMHTLWRDRPDGRGRGNGDWIVSRRAVRGDQ